VDDSLLLEASDRHAVWTRWEHLDLEAGVQHDLRIEYVDRRADAIVQLVWAQPDPTLHEAALAAATKADATVMFMGLSPRLEGEEMPVDVPGFAGGDRVDIALPAAQRTLIENVVALGKPVVLVLLNGSALAVEWAAEHVPAIVEAWYPGQAAGTAIADVLFGNYNPAGRLPVTFYRSVEQLPPFDEYAMADRTYRYFSGDPLFPFGHGLSYTTFAYGHLEVPETVQAGREVVVSALVANSGSRAGEEVVQLYVTDDSAAVPVPIRSLVGIRRVYLEPGEVRRIEFRITPRQVSLIDDTGRRVIEPGTFTVSVGGKQPGFSGAADAGTTSVVTGRFTVVGNPLELPM
jgi:beta-glucosidase